MKKTLIALAVAASAVSGMAHAWTNGDFNGSVDIGGSITADDYRQKWSWKVGGDINEFSNVFSDMTDNGTKLTITVNDDKPILIGKTNDAFAAKVASGVGAKPQIAFTDFNGESVSLKPNGTENGLGYMALPMKNTEGDKIGLVTVNFTHAGVAFVGGGEASETGLRSLYGKNGSVFSGGFALKGSELKNGELAANVTSKFGGLSATEMLLQIQEKHPSVDSIINHTGSGDENMMYTDGSVVSATYALGIASGQTLEATFEQAVTSSTEWSAPLNVAVSYQ